MGDHLSAVLQMLNIWTKRDLLFLSCAKNLISEKYKFKVISVYSKILSVLYLFQLFDFDLCSNKQPFRFSPTHFQQCIVGFSAQTPKPT